MKTNRVSPEKYILLDTNVIVGYYVPKALGATAYTRICSILESCRTGIHPEWYLMIPNIVIAEVFSTFNKYCYGTWNAHVRRVMPSGLDKRRHRTICNRFHNHIHDGQLFHQIELNRYHILWIDLIAPIDHHYMHYRSGNKVPMQTADMLVLSMGIQLNHQFGKDRFIILTADKRMSDICEKARRGINNQTADTLGIRENAELLGYGYSPDLYPFVLNLSSAKTKELADVFGEWPCKKAARSATGIKKPYG